jgi:pimeloyl-ACP methyl ester carboxylesterase
MKVPRILAVVLALCVAGWVTAASAQMPVAPTFQTVPCDPTVQGVIASRLVCGTVRVPRNHANTDAGSFALAVTVLKSAEQPAAADPVAWMGGWSARGIVHLYALEQSSKRPAMPFATSRDLILVDARGSGQSEPALCPGLRAQLMPLILALAEGDADAAIKRREAYFACRDELIRQGIDLSDFGVAVTANDLDWVRRALGIARWNAYALSSGTPAAMALAAVHTAAVRSLTLVAPVAREPTPRRSNIFAAARDALFAACARDAACAGDYPDLPRTYRQVLKSLDEKPIVMAGQPAPTIHLKDDRMRITGSVVELAIYQLIQSPGNRRILPYLISAVHEGDNGALTLVASLAWMAANSLAGDALAAAILCHDQPRLREPLPDLASILDRVDLYDICHGWSEPGRLPPMPAKSGVPTLILGAPLAFAGQSEAGQAIAALIGPSARLIDIPGVNNDVRDNTRCVWTVAADFIAQPTKEPGTSCVEPEQPIAFAPRREGLSGPIRISP